MKKIVGVTPYTYKDLASMLHQIDPTLDPRQEPSCMVVLASWCLGADLEAIAHLVGLPLDTVQTMGARLRESGIWRGGEHTVDYSELGEDSGMTILLHAQIAAGFIRRSVGTDGESLYSITKAGIHHVERLIKGKL